MIMRIIMFLILGIGMAGSCFAQSRDPGSSGESSSTGVWSSVSSSTSADTGSSVGSVSSDSSVGYGSGDHGNVS